MEIRNKLSLLEETLDVEAGSLQPDMILDDITEYDSLMKLSIMVMLEDNFGYKTNSREMKRLVTIEDLLKLMN